MKQKLVIVFFYWFFGLFIARIIEENYNFGTIAVLAVEMAITISYVIMHIEIVIMNMKILDT